MDSCAVSDALDKIGLPGSVTGIPRISTDRRIAGRVLTVKLDRAEGRTSTRHLCTTAIEAASPGTSSSASSDARRRVLGRQPDHRREGARNRGAIIDGPARDIDESRQLDFPVFARSITGRTARGASSKSLPENPSCRRYHREPRRLRHRRRQLRRLHPAGGRRARRSRGLIVQRESLMAQALRDGKRAGEVMGANYEHMLKKRMTLSDIPTPALVVDVRALGQHPPDGGLLRVAPCKLRPHFKAHKTPEIARRQLAAGSCTGLTCATVFEAEIAAPLTDDILIANEAIGSDTCRRIAALATRLTITIAIDSIAGLDEIVAAARQSGATVGALVDVNVGQNRCGVSPGRE